MVGTCVRADSPAPCVFQADDSWIALGDSITRNGGYHSYLYLFQATRFPQKKFVLHNAGISGDVVPSARKQLDWDVWPHEPTFFTIMFGMNDVNRSLYKQTEPDAPLTQLQENTIRFYQKNLSALIDTLQEKEVKIILITPSPYDATVIHSGETAPLNPSSGLRRCAEVVRELGAENKIAVIDFFAPLTQLQQMEQKTDLGFSLCDLDRIHPHPAGHFAMACLFLEQTTTQSVVSSVHLDASNGRVVLSSNAHIQVLHATPEGLDFKIKEGALPFPLSPELIPMAERFNFSEQFNREMLKIEKLLPGTYELHIDGSLIETYSAKALAKGVDLSRQRNTPQYHQAMQVAECNRKRNHIEANRLRTIAYFENKLRQLFGDESVTNPQQRAAAIETVLSSEDSSDYLLRSAKRYRDEYKPRQDEFEETVRQLTHEMWTLNQPVEHHYEIRRMQEDAL